MQGTSEQGTVGVLVVLVVTVLALIGWASHTRAAIVTFSDKAAFLAATGGSSATGPLPNLGGTSGATVGSITFSTPPGSGLNIGALNNTVPGGDWTAIIPGSDIAINGVENLNMDVASPVFALGFDFAEPSIDAQCFAPCVDSTFTVTLKNGAATVGTFTFNAPNDVLAFIGVWSDTPFTRVEIRDTTFTIDDEFFGEVFTGTRSPIIVNSTADAADAAPGNGVCETAPGNGICTLRAAIQRANAMPLPAVVGAHHDIVLPAGIYRLTLPGANEDAAATGDLDIKNAMHISGVGATTTIIDGNTLDRVFHIVDGGTLVQISGVTITGGRILSGNGGGILTQGDLTLEGTIIQANLTNGSGGGVYNSGTLTISKSTIDANIAGDDGGGIANVSGTALIVRSTISGNTAGDVVGDDGGGLFNSGLVGSPGSMTVITSTISGNGAGDDGGGIYNTANATLTLTNATVTDNEAASEAGGFDNFGDTSFQNTIIAGNRAGAAAFADCRSLSGSLVSLGHNLAGAGTGCPAAAGGTDLTIAPAAVFTTVLGPLQDNGGPTETHALCTAPGEPHESCTGASPALDAGDNTVCLDDDQRGVIRPQPHGGVCDIGAYEDIAITIDATALATTTLTFFVSGSTTRSTDTPQVIRLRPGDHFFVSATGTHFAFTLSANGTLSCEAPLVAAGVVDCATPGQLIVRGTTLKINATPLATTMLTFFLSGTPSRPTDPEQTLHLVPGDHLFVSATGTHFAFTLSANGTLSCEAPLVAAGVVDCATPGQLIVRGTTLKINATPLATTMLTFFLSGTPSRPTDPEQTLHLVPGDHLFVSATGTHFAFTLSANGTLSCEAPLVAAGVVDCATPGQLIVRGTTLKINATPLATTTLTFFLSGTPSRPTDPEQTLHLVPGDHLFVSATGTHFAFTLSANGTLSCEAPLVAAGVVDCATPGQLIVRGTTLKINATPLATTTLTFFLSGTPSRPTDPEQTLHLVPGDHLFVSATGTHFAFTLSANGTLSCEAPLVAAGVVDCATPGQLIVRGTTLKINATPLATTTLTFFLSGTPSRPTDPEQTLHLVPGDHLFVSATGTHFAFTLSANGTLSCEAPLVAAGVVDCATPGQLIVRGTTLKINATPLATTTLTFFLSGTPSRPTDPEQTLHLVPGSYIFISGTGGSFDFTVTTSGTVDYAQGLDGVLTGRGTTTLGVHGFPSIADSDGDGLNDSADNCPFTPNADQRDTDGDGIGDACDADADNDGVLNAVDNCPLVPNSNQADLDGDGLGDACDPDADGDGAVAVAFGGTDCNDAVPGTTGCLALERPNRVISPAPPDSDGDGVPDSSDNCPSIANANQANADGDSAGDACDPFPNDPQNDIDGDGISGHVDNCPTVANANQADLDRDGVGDACDPDADGDEVNAIAFGGTDCNDLDATINPSRPEIKDNNKDDDCNPDTPDRDFFIKFTVTDPTGATLDTWLPSDGRQATLKATVQTPSGSGTTVGPLTWTLVNVTAYPGKYTNDTSTDTSPDFSVTQDLPFTGSTVNVTARDFGASITLRVQVTVTKADGTPLVLQEDVTLPKDTDGDGLPDAWENLYGNLTPGGDIDTSVANTYTGDGLSNLKEYRGFIWGPELVAVEPENSNGLYQTKAWVPSGATPVHFRGNPTKKDLFVKFTGFGGCANNGCPFALGDALNAAGINVHVVGATTNPAPREQNIDVLQVSNDLVNPFNLTDGHLNKRGVRDWTWDIKGSSGIGNSTTYGVSTLYQKSLDGLFEDQPYIDANPVNNLLDRLDLVEDGNDNSLLDVLKGKSEDKNSNSVLDGDKVHLTNFTQQLSPFDINKDRKVELPVVGDPATVTGTSMFENTKAQVIKRTTTHEMGHAVGMQHTDIDTDLMSGPTPDWVHDGQFSDSAKGQMQIHNN